MENNISLEIARLEKKVLYTRVSSLIFVAVLLVGSYFEIELTILAPIVIVGALALVLFIGIPTMRKLSSLKRQLKASEF